MSRYFDFSPVKPWAGGYAEGLDAIGDSFVENRKAKLEQARADAYAAQVKATEANQKRLQAHEDITSEQGQSDRRVKLAENISNMLGSNRTNEAQATASGSQFQVPGTDKMGGVTLTKDEQGPAPPVPQVPGPAPVHPDLQQTQYPSPNPADYADFESAAYSHVSPEEARGRAMHRALGGATQPPAQGSAQELLSTAAGEGAAGVAERAQDARGRYASDSLAHDINQSAYDQQKKDYDVKSAAYTDRQQHPTFTMGMPGGQKVTIDPREAKLAKEDEARQTAAMLRKQAAVPGQPAHVVEQMLLSANAIEAQLPAAAAGAINNARSQTQGDETKNTLQGKQITSNEKIAAGHDRARIIARAHGKGGGGGNLPGAAENRVLTEIDKSLESVNRKGGLGEQLQHSEAALTAIHNDPQNPVNWVNAIDAAIRTNTGRAAILSQYKLYTGKAAGVNDTADQLWAGFTGAGLSDTQKRNLLASFQGANGELRKQSKDAYDKASAYEQDPRVTGNKSIGLGYHARVRNTFGGMPGYGGRKGATDETAAAPAQAPAALSPEDQSAIKMARERLAKNPADTVAKRVLDLHGLKE